MRYISSPVITILLSGISGVPVYALAQETTDAETVSNGWWQLVSDNVLGITIIFLLLSAIISAVIKNRKRDRVLKEFEDFPVELELADGKKVWGGLRVYPNGIEIVYKERKDDKGGHVEESFFLHQAEFSVIRSLVRPIDVLSPGEKRRRKKELLRYIHPTFYRRSKRFLLIQISILRDAIVQVFSLIIGKAKSVGTGTVGSLIETQSAHITNIGSTVIGSVSLMNDPILESLFGQAVVIEVKDNDEWREIHGFLKEYSADFLVLLRASWPEKNSVNIAQDESRVIEEISGVKITYNQGELILENKSGHRIDLVSILAGDLSLEMPIHEIADGSTLQIEREDLTEDQLTLHLDVFKPGDLIVPRQKSLVRHRGKKEDLSLLEDLGIGRKK